MSMDTKIIMGVACALCFTAAALADTAFVVGGCVIAGLGCLRVLMQAKGGRA